MKVLRHLPNALTCGNLLCGAVAIFGGAEAWSAAYFVWAACGFDFLDGFAARLLNVSSPIGKELDSLADLVSFGILPAFMLYNILTTELLARFFPGPDFLRQSPYLLLAYVPLLLVIFSALRLAKFNIDENQKDVFIGLPTPASALFLTGLPLLPEPIRALAMIPGALIGIVVAISIMLVSPIELFSLKFKNFSWAENSIRFTFLLLAVLLLAWLQAGAISLIILLYIAISLVARAFSH